jgi:quercetin dioxygenase-like cupin family protein
VTTIHSLDALAREQLDAARSSAAARAAATLYGGHDHALRQTVIALRADAVMSEHENPGEATVLVLSGRVVLTAGNDSWEAAEGDFVAVPDELHTVRAAEDSVILLSAVPRAHIG